MNSPLVTKTILHKGSKYVPYTSGTKVTFHYKTIRDDGQVLDDSKEKNSPMELIIGKKFKLEVWESAVQTMALDEVATFKVDKSLTSSYPIVAKTLRDVQKSGDGKDKHRTHMCAADLQAHGVGYQDLNQLMQNPCELHFVLQVIKIQSENEYEKESWQMTDEQKRVAIPQLKEQGNVLYNSKDFKKAAEKYSLAIGYLEQLMLKEKPKDDEWNDLNKIKVAILLNLAQCKLLEADYYAVIEFCSTVLESDPKNIKALYRRGRAHIGAWNCQSAKEDLACVSLLDPSLEHLVQKHLIQLESLQKAKDNEDRIKLHGKMF